MLTLASAKNWKAHVRQVIPKSGPAWLVLLAILTILASFGLLINDWPRSRDGEGPDWEVAAQRGDFWGGHLALATSLGGNFLFLAALAFQLRELRLQREQLDAQLEEQRSAREVQMQQMGNLERQAQLDEKSFVSRTVLEVVDARMSAAENVQMYEKVIEVMRWMAAEHKVHWQQMKAGSWPPKVYQDAVNRSFASGGGDAYIGGLAELVRFFGSTQLFAHQIIKSASAEDLDYENLYGMLGHIPLVLHSG